MDLWNGFVAALPLLQSAWPTVVGLLIVSWGIGLGVGRFQYGERIEILKERLTQRDEEIAELREASRKQSEAPAANQSPPAALQIARELRNLREYFDTFRKGVDERSISSSRPMDDIRKHAEEFESVLTSLMKMGFQVPRLDLAVDPIGYVEMVVEYCDKVSPLLLRDHIAEARAASIGVAYAHMNDEAAGKL